MNFRKEAKHPVWGNCLSFDLPSGKRLTIREQNGDDEGLLSRVQDAETGDSMVNFASAIVLKDHELNRKPSPLEIKEWRISDFYSLLFISRVFSLGNLFEFKFTWPDQEQPSEYEEDLYIYLQDSLDEQENPKNKSPHMMKPYLKIEGDNIEAFDKKGIIFNTASGKKLKFEYLITNTEVSSLEIPVDKQDKNLELRQRNLSMYAEGEWHILNNFAGLSSKDMKEVRTLIRKYDPVFEPLMKIPHPVKKHISTEINLLTQKDFFYPEGQ